MLTPVKADLTRFFHHGLFSRPRVARLFVFETHNRHLLTPTGCFSLSNGHKSVNYTFRSSVSQYKYLNRSLNAQLIILSPERAPHVRSSRAFVFKHIFFINGDILQTINEMLHIWQVLDIITCFL